MPRVVSILQSFMDVPEMGKPYMDQTGTAWFCPHCHRPVSIGERQCFFCKLLMDWRDILGPREDDE